MRNFPHSEKTWFRQKLFCSFNGSTNENHLFFPDFNLIPYKFMHEGLDSFNHDRIFVFESFSFVVVASHRYLDEDPFLLDHHFRRNMFVLYCHDDSQLFGSFVEVSEDKKVFIEYPNCRNCDFVLDDLTLLELA